MPSTNPFDSDSESDAEPTCPNPTEERPPPRPAQDPHRHASPLKSSSSEATSTFRRCLMVAEQIRSDAAGTLAALHQQGERMTRTHLAVADIDRDLSVGEKLLGSLGGIFSRPWKPRFTRSVKGPVLVEENGASPCAAKGERLGLGLEKERGKREDDALSDLSNLLGELKGMAVDMGCELDRQNGAMSGLLDDVDELNFRVKGANQRGRRLLGK